VIAFLLLAVVGLAVVVAVRYSIASPSRVTLADVPRILDELQSAGDPAFAVLTLALPDRTLGTVDLQLAVDGGRPGFDWVLCGESNEAEQERFVAFARGEGYAPELREVNEVCYYRIEGGDLSRLCNLIVTKLYGKPPDEPLELLVEGFEWPPQVAR
jgi:hypothetical protein